MRWIWKSIVPPAMLGLVGVFSAGAQAPGRGTLPATAPTGTVPVQGTPASALAPISASAPARNRTGAGSHRASVSCAGGLLTVHADNASLNGILRGVARCSGMQITGTVPDQRVFGDYGPEAPATVLETLLDGTGTNVFLRETAQNQPAQLILTPRTGGASPPAAFIVSDDEEADVSGGYGGPQPNTQPGDLAGGQYAAAPAQGQGQGGNQIRPAAGQAQQVAPPGLTPVPLPLQGSAVTSPASIPQPTNNVNGSPLNSSPTVGTYPTTNSVPIDTLPTPSTTPSTSGIVDAPNPPAAGSDTAALLNGINTNQPGTTNINPEATSSTSTPGGTNTTVPAPPASGTPASGTLTPEQIYQQLQQLRTQGAQPGQPSPQ